MSTLFKVLFFALPVFAICMPSPALAAAAVEQHDAQTDEQAEERQSVTLTPRQAGYAGLEVRKLRAAVADIQVYAPGEIRANGYTSYQVSPRVDSVVLRRHAGLGDHVTAGQPLVTLFSETVAQAQAEFQVASSEWRRVEALGRKTVGDQRYVSTESGYQAAYGRLQAYGLSDEAITSLVGKPLPLGEYTLIARIGGAVLSDDFHQGQRVAAGEPLMELADEKALWVEARLAPTADLDLPVGTAAQVRVGDALFTARVTQEAHTIDPVTRTRVIRLLVDNEQHLLHPGLFADVYFSVATKAPVIAVPESALIRNDEGEWTVFVETAPGKFSPQTVTLGRALGDGREISGIAAGTPVVMHGAFFVASELSKGGFDPHNH